MSLTWFLAQAWAGVSCDQRGHSGGCDWLIALERCISSAVIGLRDGGRRACERVFVCNEMSSGSDVTRGKTQALLTARIIRFNWMCVRKKKRNCKSLWYMNDGPRVCVCVFRFYIRNTSICIAFPKWIFQQYSPSKGKTGDKMLSGIGLGNKNEVYFVWAFWFSERWNCPRDGGPNLHKWWNCHKFDIIIFCLKL